MFRTLAISAALLAFTMTQGLAASQPPLYRGEYAISFLGLPVARVNFDSRVDKKGYSIEGEASSAGLGAFFYDTHGKLTASGRFADGVRADHFRAEYRYDKKPTLVDIRFSGGNVVKVVNDPPLKKRGKDWVPIKPADLKSASTRSPRLSSRPTGWKMSARAVRGCSTANCAPTSALSHVRTGEMSIKGFKGPTVTCRLKFTPAAGYRKGRRALEFLRTKSRIMVTFAQIGETGVYAPVHATIGTQIGTITVRARRLEAL